MNKIVRKLDLPPDVPGGSTIVTVYGTHDVKIENYLSILEYSPEYIKLLGRNIRIEICGKQLIIDEFSNDECNVFGCIEILKYNN